MLRKERSLDFNDITFDNFERQPVDIRQYTHKLRAAS
jgi:hypothetical protein